MSVKTQRKKKLHHLCLLDSFSNFIEYNRIKVVKFNREDRINVVKLNRIWSYKGNDISDS